MMSERAVHKLKGRRRPPTCYLFDMELNGRYWHWWDERSIHNTGLITPWCVHLQGNPAQLLVVWQFWPPLPV